MSEVARIGSGVRAAVAPAGFWRRYAAWSLDIAVVGALATLLGWSSLVSGWQGITAASARLSDLLGSQLADALMRGTRADALAPQLLADPAVQAAATAVEAGIDRMLLPWLLWLLVLAALWFVGFEAGPWQATPGKRALRMRVVRAADDARAPLARIALRHVSGALSWLTLNLGHLLAAVSPRGRALHDLVAGTRVVSDAAEPRLPLWARTWLVLQVLALFVLLAWGLARYMAMLRASLG
jgi:uncharacterized RDD family membrane protein YckC